MKTLTFNVTYAGDPITIIKDMSWSFLCQVLKGLEGKEITKVSKGKKSKTYRVEPITC